MSEKELLIFLAAIFIAAGLILCAISVPMFVAAWNEYKIMCPDGNNHVPRRQHEG
jgi:hypothetical protein